MQNQEVIEEMERTVELPDTEELFALAIQGSVLPELLNDFIYVFIPRSNPLLHPITRVAKLPGVRLVRDNDIQPLSGLFEQELNQFIVSLCYTLPFPTPFLGSIGDRG